jgi:hypothetical protein
MFIISVIGLYFQFNRWREGRKSEKEQNEEDNGLLANEPTGGEQSGGVVEVERGAIGGEV